MPYPYDRDQELVPTDGHEYLTTPEAAAYLRLAAGTLQNWRGTDGERGPAFCRFGRSVRYRRADLDRWATYEDTRTEV